MEKLKGKGFWVSLIALVIMLARLFGADIDAPYINEVIDSVCAVCVLMGLGSGRSNNDSESKKDDTSDDEENLQ